MKAKKHVAKAKCFFYIGFYLVAGKMLFITSTYKLIDSKYEYVFIMCQNIGFCQLL